MALESLGSRGMLTLNGVDLVKFVSDMRAMQIATENAFVNEDAKLEEYQGQILGSVAGSDLNNYRGKTSNGNKAKYSLYYVANQPTSVANMPPNPWTGYLEVLSSPNEKIFIQRMTYDDGSGTWERRILDGTGGLVFGIWKRLDNTGGDLSRAMLVERERQRRGGAVGTNGLAVVALRFDHWLTDFETKVLPLLKKYDLPWAQAINPETMADAANSGMTWAELQTACLDHGGELANHGGNHLDATTAAAMHTQIVGSLNSIRSNAPKLAVSQWMPPGLAAGGYGGYSPMETVAQHTDTFAGRLILANHAFVSGYLPGLYRELDGSNPVGLVHTTIDAQTPTAVDGIIAGAVTARAGLQLMLHPTYLDQAGYMTTADLEAVFSNIATRRDNGELLVLTPSGMLLADRSVAVRHNLAVNGGFRDGLTGWANTTGWSVNTAGQFPYATTSTGTPLTQAVSFTRKEKLLGGTRELSYMVRATGGAVVRTAATGTGLGATKDHTIPASTNWVEVRKALTVPADFTGDLTVASGRVSGGAVDITNVRLQSI